MSTTHLILAAADSSSTTVLADSINQWVQNKSRETTTTLQIVGTLAGVIAFLVISASRRFSIGSTIMGVIVGGLVIWGVYGVTTVKDKVTDEVKPTTPGTGVSAPAFGSVPDPWAHPIVL